MLLFHLTHVYLLQVFCLKAIASDHTVPTKSRLNIKSICIAMIGAFQWFFQLQRPSFGRIIPNIDKFLLRTFSLLHPFLPLPQSIQHVFLVHLFHFYLWKLTYSSIFISIDSSRLLRNHEIRFWRLRFVLLFNILLCLSLFFYLFLLFLLFILNFEALFVLL